ncbi:MAG: redoxin domain-containing protein [Planctomycetaceae bacterium]|nr:redoxin domain-containing protein [Planctomycetaceae bacterium]
MKILPFRKNLLAAALAALAATLPVVASAAAATADSAPRKIEGFTLRDYRGQEHSLPNADEANVVVVAFLGVECPLAKLYAGRLEQLQKEFADHSVRFIGIDSNRQDSVTELADYAEAQQVTFPLLKDPGNKVADLFGAERTPQVFVLDQSRTIRYAGAIDDQYGIGIQRKQPTARYLADAVTSLLADKPVSLAQTAAVGCQIGRMSAAKPTGEITYSKHIAPIFQSRCAECHRPGEIAPFPLLTYEDALGWEPTILEVIAENRMPPWLANPAHGEFKNDARLSEEEKTLIRTWVENGSPEGDPADLPAPPEFAEGWRYREPDQVIRMNDKPFDVPAEGVVDYQYYVVDPGWDEDKYVVAAEARPDNRAVVHHIIAYVLPPGSDPRKDHERRQMLVGYAPGSPPAVFGDGRAMRIKAGSKLLFELHYTPNGVAQSDLSYIGVTFTDADQVKSLVEGVAIVNPRFEIPPGSDNYEVVAQVKAPKDLFILRMMPHMHLRGKAFRYEAVYADGKREVLLDVPKYDFNWQLSYELAKPKFLPKGTEVVCTAAYDNSKGNPSNPDPDATVHWGEQSWDEMMIGFCDVVAAEDERQEVKAAVIE